MKRFLLAAASRVIVITACTVLASLARNSAASGGDNMDAQIECITPDGRVGEVASAGAETPHAAASIINQDTLRCALQEGHTTFVIKLPTSSPLDRFTFVNENAAAAGELKIYVSNTRLSAASGEWLAVDGRIAFTHKRLFNLSMVGVEARYVKLEFNVEKGAPLAAAELHPRQTHRSGENQALVSNRFEASSNFARRRDG